MDMVCPRCQSALYEVTKAGVVADVCTKCRGIWLDRGELQELVTQTERPQQGKSHGSGYAGTNAGLATQTVRGSLRTGESGFLRCPRCGDPLCETHRDGVRVDLCRQCRGVWLDDGELERIKACLRDLRNDWERDEENPGKSIRWDRPLRYPRHHPRRHWVPPVPPREPRRARQVSHPLFNRHRSADGRSTRTRPLEDAGADENAHGPRETNVERRRSVLGAAWRACRPTAGTLLILLGCLLMFVPVLPGAPLILMGMAVAGSSHPLVRFLHERWRRVTAKRGQSAS